MSPEKKDDKCCDNPQVREVKGDLGENCVLGTTCSSCGKTKPSSANN
jgi:hypothetical protein